MSHKPKTTTGYDSILVQTRSVAFSASCLDRVGNGTLDRDPSFRSEALCTIDRRDRMKCEGMEV